MFAYFSFLVVACFVISLSKFSLGLVNVHAFPTLQSCQSIFLMFSAVEECVLQGSLLADSVPGICELQLWLLFFCFPSFFFAQSLPDCPCCHTPSTLVGVCALHTNCHCPLQIIILQCKDGLAFTSLVLSMQVVCAGFELSSFCCPHKLALLCVVCVLLKADSCSTCDCLTLA